MADYRPLVERLISGLPRDDAEARAAAYGAARAALERQFDAAADGDGERDAERRALADAIDDVEAGFSNESQAPVAAHADVLARGGAEDEPPDPADDRGGLAGDASPAPRLIGARRSTLAAASLCALLVGAGAWWSVHRHAHLGSPATGDVGAVGAAVPDPVGQLGAPEGSPASANPVAQRAALLVDAPGEPQRLKTYTGHVLWQLVRPDPATDHAAAVRVRAAVDIPEAGLRAEVVFDRNAAPQLSASHTAEVRFTRRPGVLLSGIDRISVLEMRDGGSPTGEQLVGSQTKVADDFFLIGLSAAGHEAENLRLLRSRPWMDLPVLLDDRREAKLTFEKGATGDAVWSEALAAWATAPAQGLSTDASAPTQRR